jgi:hypothetical protein
MSNDHIVHNVVTQKMECQHCGFQKAVKMPDTIDSILAQFDAFIGYHRGCKAPVTELVMSEYIKGFDAGYSYVLNEIEMFIKTHDYDPRFIGPVEILLAQLKATTRETT